MRINKTINCTAIWLRRIGDKVQMLAEIDGKWRLAAEECFDGPFSHIAEGNGVDNWPLDSVTSNYGEAEKVDPQDYIRMLRFAEMPERAPDICFACGSDVSQQPHVTGCKHA